MIEQALEWLRCPRTGSRLILDGDELVAQTGGHRYPVHHGIPDVRLFDPPYMTRREEEAAVDEIMAASARMTYDELLGHFERHILTERRSKDAIERQLEHRRALRERAPARLRNLFAQAGIQRIQGNAVLDLGCGSGEATPALYEFGGKTIYSVDISLAELALAKKLLAEDGFEAFLVAGCAEALPFADEFFDFVYSPDVIEHVSDQPVYLAEAWRVLNPGAQLLLNSPNRYALVCPEPHTGIWFLGFVPRRLTDPVCRLLGKGPYVGKRLVSQHELQRLLSGSFPTHRIFSRRSNPHAESVPGRVFYATRRWSEPAFSLVCDEHVVSATK